MRIYFPLIDKRDRERTEWERKGEREYTEVLPY